MKKKMKAAVLYEIKTPLVVEEIEIDEPKQGEVLVKIVATGVCHSDLHFIEGLWPWPTPVVLGHEAAGIVERVGEGVASVQPGDHVVLAFAGSCGVCRYCVRGKPYLCSQGLPSPFMKDGTTRLSKGEQPIHHFIGVSSFAEYVVMPETAMVKIRDDAPLEKVCVISCAVMTGVGAVINTAKVEVGSSVAVFGCGGVGLNIIQGAKLAGATKIIAVDKLDNKLALAEQFGATHVINASNKNPVTGIQAITGGGADYAFEAIGNVEVIAQAVDAVDRGGMMVVVGTPPLVSSVCVGAVGLFLDKTLRGCYYGSTRFRLDMPMLADLYMAGKLKIDELITRTYPLEEINEAFDAMRNGEVARSVITF
jgi:S-(hydroxymethyl)glutathione dehydrogenase/alcohol dehydrogenase